MGFFKFLKKREQTMDDMSSLDNLEMPPPPTSIDDDDSTFEPSNKNNKIDDDPNFDLDEEFSIPYKEDINNSIDNEMTTESENIAPKIKKSSERITNKPLFVKADVYREILTEITHVKELLKRSDEGISRINSDINGESKEFEKWHNTLKEIQRRMLIVDKNLFKR